MSYYEQQQHDQLVEELKGYWTTNNWNIDTLKKKTVYQLLGIKNSIRNRSNKVSSKNSNKQINKKTFISKKEKEVYKQLTLF